MFKRSSFSTEWKKIFANHVSDKELIFQNIQRAPKTQQGFSGGSGVKNLPANAEMWVWSLGQKDPSEEEMAIYSSVLFYLFIYFIFKLYIIVLVLPNIKMNLPQVYMCSPSWTLLPPPSPFHPSGLSQCTSPKHPVSSCLGNFMDRGDRQSIGHGVTKELDMT